MYTCFSCNSPRIIHKLWMLIHVVSCWGAYDAPRPCQLERGYPVPNPTTSMSRCLTRSQWLGIEAWFLRPWGGPQTKFLDLPPNSTYFLILEHQKKRACLLSTTIYSKRRILFLALLCRKCASSLASALSNCNSWCGGYRCPQGAILNNGPILGNS